MTWNTFNKYAGGRHSGKYTEYVDTYCAYVHPTGAIYVSKKEYIDLMLKPEKVLLSAKFIDYHGKAKLAEENLSPADPDTPAE